MNQRKSMSAAASASAMSDDAKSAEMLKQHEFAAGEGTSFEVVLKYGNETKSFYTKAATADEARDDVLESLERSAGLILYKCVVGVKKVK